ncbi:winged helix-turn-helix domain-containing protein [Cupriavidus sp. UYPR2.512]|uniref:winged helix-turn-helix domain-containing protein n=1 Tax=Cupriavidus sp. UYPR2.512 TaxID=1080187 RepID=UPI0012FC4717|nr:winged helix-turn-helix domain-containing protein [Cupriavidus sp. UYPR2.512]UIF88533.1 DNA-binding protein [Cupriavidus necator]
MTTHIPVGGELVVAKKYTTQFEGHSAARGLASPTEPDPVNSEASNSFEDPDFLPARIMKAIALAYESRFFVDLSITTRQVLAALIRFSLSDKCTHQLAFVKKETLARHVGVSEATIYRALSTLEGQGLIEREKQLRTRLKLQNIGRIRFTPKLLVALGILRTTKEASALAARCDGPKKNEPTRSGTYCTHLTSVTDVNPGVNKQSSTKKQSSRGFAFKIINGKPVPADLAWLAESNALAITGIFKLMKVARDTGKRLSDVVAVSKHPLGKLRGRELFAYLSVLLTKEVDFTFVSKVQAEAGLLQRQQAEQDAKKKARINELATLLRGKTFDMQDGSAITVDEASVVICRGAYTSSTPIHLALQQLEALASGKGKSWAGQTKPDRTARRPAAVTAQLAENLALLRQRRHW